MNRSPLSLFVLFLAAVFSAALTCCSATAIEPQKNGEKQPEFNVKNEFNGTISDLRQQKVENAERLMAMFKGDKGGQAMVDFGKPDDTAKLGLKDGEHVTVSGPLVRFSDELVIVADKAEVNGKSVEIDRKLHNISGQIAAMQYTAFLIAESGGRNVEESGTTHLVVAVTDKQGKKTWIDLGPGRHLANLQLKPGDEITASGVFTGFQGNDVLAAQDIEKGQQKHVVDWTIQMNQQNSKAQNSNASSRTPNSRVRNPGAENPAGQNPQSK